MSVNYVWKQWKAMKNLQAKFSPHFEKTFTKPEWLVNYHLSEPQYRL